MGRTVRPIAPMGLNSMFRTVKACSAALGLVALGLGGCATITPTPFEPSYLSERMSAEEAGYTQVFVDTILAACETARSPEGQRFLRRDKVRKSATGLNGMTRVAAMERRLLATGPSTVRPVFRSVREFEVPLVQTPPITARHELAARVAPPALYASLHEDIVELMRLVDKVKQNGNRAKVSQVEELVHQARAVCEGNSVVVGETYARAEDGAAATRRVAILGEDAPSASMHMASADETGADETGADETDDRALEPQATVQMTAGTMDPTGADTLIVPAPTRFLTVQTAPAEDGVARLRLFTVRDGFELELDPDLRAAVQANETLDTLVTLR